MSGRSRPGLDDATARPAVIVVPFNSDGRDARGYWLREASAVILTDDLMSIGIAAMSRDERLRAFDSLRVPATARLSHATVIRVGQIVGAMRVIVGSCAIAGDTLTVRARSILLDNGQLSPEVVESGPLANMFDVYERVARHVAEGLPRGAARRDRSVIRRWRHSSSTSRACWPKRRP